MADKKEKKYLIDNPALMAEWDWEKNNELGLLPNQLTYSSHQKVWWKCKNGHSWQASIIPRVRTNHPTGCPYCAGNLPTTGVNDFATLYPDLIKEWDFEKNKTINPSYLTAHSGKRVWWKCHYCGFSWQTTIHNRSTNKRGCPNCSIKGTSFGEQALYYYVKKIYPNAINRYKDLGFELDIFIPNINIGIEFDGLYFHSSAESIKRDNKKYQLCKKYNIKLLRIKDSTSKKNQNTADKIFGIDNLKDKKQLNNIIRLVMNELDLKSNMWTRKNINQFSSSIDREIDIDKDYFKILDNKYLREINNSFAIDYPEILKDWDYNKNKEVNPYSLTRGCGFKINWKCHKCGFEWKSRIPDRIKGSGCPCCNRKVLVENVNDLATLHPEALKEWNYEKNNILPSKVIKYSQTYWWKCSICGFEWQATINDRFIRKNKTGCPECARQAIYKERHRKAIERGGFFKIFPELIVEWDYSKNKDVDPYDIPRASNIKYWWKCPKCGYEWQASTNMRYKRPHLHKCK